MTRDPLSDGRLAEAWTAPSGRCPSHEHCPDEGRYWDLARGGLSAVEVESLLDHTALCTDCALALSAAVAVHAESGLPAPQTAAARPSLWDRLAASVLRPEAALAYVLLVAVGFVGWWSAGRRPVETAAITAATVIGLEPESIARGTDAGSVSPLALPRSGPVVLRLFVDRGEVDPNAPLRVTLAAPDRTLAAIEYAPSSLGEAGAVDLVVDAAALPMDAPLALEVRSGDRVVFARKVRRAPR